MHHSTPGAHDQHDLELIAGHAAGDLSDTERTLVGLQLTQRK